MHHHTQKNFLKKLPHRCHCFLVCFLEQLTALGVSVDEEIQSRRPSGSFVCGAQPSIPPRATNKRKYIGLVLHREQKFLVY
jgi:hypothetical protein